MALHGSSSLVSGRVHPGRRKQPAARSGISRTAQPDLHRSRPTPSTSRGHKFARPKGDPGRTAEIARSAVRIRANRAARTHSPQFAAEAQVLGTPSTKPFNPNARQTSAPRPVSGRPGVVIDSIASSGRDPSGRGTRRPPPLHGLPPRPGTQLPKAMTDFTPAPAAGPRAQLKINPNSSIFELAGAAGLGINAAKSRILRTRTREQRRGGRRRSQLSLG